VITQPLNTQDPIRNNKWNPKQETLGQRYRHAPQAGDENKDSVSLVVVEIRFLGIRAWNFLSQLSYNERSQISQGLSIPFTRLSTVKLA
jgi:hypothetical protein